MAQQYNDAPAVDYVDINKQANIAIVQDTGEDLDSDDNQSLDEPVVEHPAEPRHESSTRSPDKSLASTPGSAARETLRETPKEATRSARRTRGVSLLPVRQSEEPARVASSPPHTPTPLTPMGARDRAHSASTPPTVGSIGRVTPSSGSRRDTVTSKTPTLDHAKAPGAVAVDNDKLLSTYISQLATKEAHVGDLRVALNELQAELQEAEEDLTKFKENGKRLAEIVHGENSQRTIPGDKPVRRQAEVDSQKHMMDVGRRVVDGIGTQFWSFLEDVKSATMGNDEFDRSNSELRANGRTPRDLPPPRRNVPTGSRLADIPRSQSPPRRQISPRRSIQNFIKNRSPSPIRNPLSPSKSPSRQEIAEHRASQRLRESERLTKKLSHINLRSPSPPETPSELS